jgi:hypothetical protein
VKFEEPQPPDVDNETSIKSRVQGKYLNLADSSILIISEKRLVKISDLEVKVSKKEADTSANYSLQGDTLTYVEKDNRYKIKIKFLRDTLFGTYKWMDTIFSISDKNLLRWFKGCYFLNSKTEDNLWSVQQLDYHWNGELELNEISGNKEIDNLKIITDVEEIKDSSDKVISYHVNPTKREFKKFLRKNVFSDKNSFIKIK